MRASVWVALRSMVIGVLIVSMTVPLALAGRRHGCSPCYSAPACSPCYSAPSCYSYAGDCSSYVWDGGCYSGGCSVGGSYYAPVADCPNCIVPTHPDPSVVDGQPPVQYAPPAPAPAPAGGAGAGGPMNDAPPPPNNNNNLRPAPAPAPVEEEPAPPPARPAPPAPEPAPEAVPPKAPADDPFGPGAAAPKPNNNAVAPAVLEAPEEAAPAAAPAAEPAEPAKPAPAAPADDDPFKISTEGRLPARVWTDDTGEFRVFARLVEIREGKVRLLKETGRTTTVPFARLSAEDREYVRGAQSKFGQGQIGQVAAR